MDEASCPGQRWPRKGCARVPLWLRCVSSRKGEIGSAGGRDGGEKVGKGENSVKAPHKHGMLPSILGNKPKGDKKMDRSTLLLFGFLAFLVRELLSTMFRKSLSYRPNLWAFACIIVLFFFSRQCPPLHNFFHTIPEFLLNLHS